MYGSSAVRAGHFPFFPLTEQLAAAVVAFAKNIGPWGYHTAGSYYHIFIEVSGLIVVAGFVCGACALVSPGIGIIAVIMRFTAIDLRRGSLVARGLICPLTIYGCAHV
jgi:hypothetical protein